MELTKSKNLLAGAILVMLTAFTAGCHHSIDGYRGYGYRGYSGGYGTYRDGTYRDGSYRDGFRDGRSYERRIEDRYGRRDSWDWYR
jgi:hypothetical protein